MENLKGKKEIYHGGSNYTKYHHLYGSVKKREEEEKEKKGKRLQLLNLRSLKEGAHRKWDSGLWGDSYAWLVLVSFELTAGVHEAGTQNSKRRALSVRDDISRGIL